MQIKPNNPNFDSGPNIGGWSTFSNYLVKVLEEGGNYFFENEIQDWNF